MRGRQVCVKGVPHQSEAPVGVVSEVSLNASFRNLVTCLSVSMDGTLLLSGSHDESARLWDIQSKQSIRCLAHKGKPRPHRCDITRGPHTLTWKAF